MLKMTGGYPQPRVRIYILWLLVSIEEELLFVIYYQGISNWGNNVMSTHICSDSDITLSVSDRLYPTNLTNSCQNTILHLPILIEAVKKEELYSANSRGKKKNRYTMKDSKGYYII